MQNHLASVSVFSQQLDFGLSLHVKSKNPLYYTSIVQLKPEFILAVYLREGGSCSQGAGFLYSPIPHTTCCICADPNQLTNIYVNYSLLLFLKAL